MIREMKIEDEITITVKLKSGEIFEKRDITQCPFGQYEKMVGFWEGDVVRVYPLQDVEYIEFNP